MTDFPITFDGRRTTAGELEILKHRRAANTRSMPETFGDPVETELNSAMSAGPAEAPNVRIRK